MHVLFVHKNFPAQFRYIAPRLVTDFGWKCTFATERKDGSLPGVDKVIYASRGGATRANHVCTRSFENAVADTHGVYEALKSCPHLKPDLIVAHTGFGSSLFLPYLFDAPIINFLEYFYQPVGGDLGYRPELPVTELALLRIKTRNAMILLDLDNCERGWTPTHYQRDFFPREYHGKIETIFDGVDTGIYYRRAGVERRIGDRTVPPGTRIVTYVARGFEMMRGFDIFMKAAKRIYEEFSDVVFVVVGTDRVHYGSDLRYIRSQSLRHHILETDDYDRSKFIFTGWLSETALGDILSISDLHIYLTQPFIASWSMVDAMACGTVLLASDQKCVREYVADGHNGLLCDFFNADELARRAVEVLKDPAAFRALGDAAAATVRERYSLDVALPRLKRFYEEVVACKRQPSVLLSKLERRGSMGDIGTPGDDPDDDVTGSVASAIVRGGATEPLPDVSQLPPLEGALTLLRAMAERRPTLNGWIQFSQDFCGPPGEFASIGPRHHPADLRRMLDHVRRSDAQLLLDIGAGDGGMTLLLSRAACDRAKIICAALPGTTLSPDRVKFLQFIAKPQQTVVALHGFTDWIDLYNGVAQAGGGRNFDFVFLSAFRPLGDVQLNFRHFRQRIRRGGLLAWDGVQPLVDPGCDRNGGDRLWREVKPLFPRHGEFLAGTRGREGGIVMVKVGTARWQESTVRK